MNDEKIDCAVTREPEEAIAIAKYLLELIQQDLNMGRRETIAPRLTKAVDELVSLQTIFPKIEPPPVVISNEAAEEYYKERGYTLELPTSTGLYRVATKENNWYINYVAVVLDHYWELSAHDEKGVVKVSNYGEERGGKKCYWLRVKQKI